MPEKTQQHAKAVETLKMKEAAAKTEPKNAAPAEAQPLRGKDPKSLDDYEKGYLAALDASMKVAFEHERARSVATPIADAIQELQPQPKGKRS